jgi:putative transposase
MAKAIADPPRRWLKPSPSDRCWCRACSDPGMAHHPHRLSPDHYRGRFTYFLTACTYQRHEAFRDPEVSATVKDHLLRACRKHGFADIAHTFMPDHVHIEVEGLRADSDYLKWHDLFRQLSGFWYKQRTRQFLWQEGDWDYTLRDAADVAPIASYIVWNPVVAGLTSTPEEYPFSGSERFVIRELAAIPPRKPRIGDI